VFVELALISSHAPWEPIPPLIDDWNALGDGGVFAGMADAGGPRNWPHDAAVNYPKAVAYSLRAVGSFAASFLADGGMLVALGDHQPASLITGEGASRAVPIHLIARDPALLAPFRDWGFTPGMVPGHDAATHRMDEFRARFHGAYAGGAAAEVEAVAEADDGGVVR
ncbi:MAG TPA: hypothetical protein VFG47_09555, partial [Geminicoccaceae bacterium]|nr:hypothetical protein [Geminicoccaceae bacterium]